MYRRIKKRDLCRHGSREGNRWGDIRGREQETERTWVCFRKSRWFAILWSNESGRTALAVDKGEITCWAPSNVTCGQVARNSRCGGALPRIGIFYLTSSRLQPPPRLATSLTTGRSRFGCSCVRKMQEVTSVLRSKRLCSPHELCGHCSSSAAIGLLLPQREVIRQTRRVTGKRFPWIPRPDQGIFGKRTKLFADRL